MKEPQTENNALMEAALSRRWPLASYARPPCPFEWPDLQHGVGNGPALRLGSLLRRA